LRLLAVIAVALTLVPLAAASERHPTLGELEGEVICPACHTTLDQSSAPIAREMKVFIARRIRAGDTKSQIEQKLIVQFGPEVIAKPSKHGFDLVAWLLPFALVAVGAAGVGVAAWTWRRSSQRTPEAQSAPLDPELERRVDEELARFEA